MRSWRLTPARRWSTRRTMCAPRCSPHFAAPHFAPPLRPAPHPLTSGVHPPRDLIEPSQEGCTPLHYASWSGRVDIVVELLRAGADTNITNAAGKTASEEAKEQKQDGVVKMIASGPPEPEGGAEKAE